MSKLTISAILLSSVAFCPLSFADSQTITLGYAQSKVHDSKDMKGANLKYRYEWDSPLSVMGSFTYMTSKESDRYEVEVSDLDNDISTYNTLDINNKVKYYSLSAGPAYRINNYVSVYGLIGVNYTKVDGNAIWDKNTVASSREDYSASNSSLMYGAGFQINPMENIAIDIGYEGTRTKFDGGKYPANGFNIGIGYRF